MKTRLIRALLLSLTFLSLSFTQGKPEITADELRNHIRFLASDKLEGRGTGTEGERLASEYLAQQFKRIGLKVVGSGGYFQKFGFTSGVKLGDNNTAMITTGGSGKSLVLNLDFRPMGFSSSDSFDGEVVFAGYGISLPDKQYDDYTGIDVAGKAVVILRNHPDGDNPHSEFGLGAALRYKTAKAKEKGAKVVIFVTGPADDEKDILVPLTYDQSMGDAGIMAITVTRDAAAWLVGPTTIASLQQDINGKKKPNSFPLAGKRFSLSTQVLKVETSGTNVLGFLEGGDKLLQKENVIIGAHYDHLGLGGSGSLTPDTVAIHNGADDNASGTAGLLELAEFLSSRRSELRRSVLFIAFSGEERGLLGSAFYVKNPLLPLDQSVAMINMDMIGRMNNRKLIVYGIGTSPGFEQLVTAHNADSTFDLRLVKDGFGPSDHSSFYGSGIPVFHFFTDLHSDYHKPSDDWDKINYEGMTSILNFVASIALDVNQGVERPSYVRVDAPRQPTASGQGRARSYTGTIPDFGEQVEGMKISGVTDGSPAAKAGLQGGDVIVKFGKIEIKNLYDYTFALGEYKPGDEVEVIVKRGTETKNFRLTIGKRN
ncbi:MAG: M28 family peptidase [Bacteroidota bacterium]